MFGSSARRGGGSRTVADVVEDIGYGPSQLRTNILVNGSWLADGAEIFMISATTSAIAKEWDVSGISIGLITSVVYTGTFLGNLISGILGDSWGRRIPVVICFPVICLCTIASSLAQEFWQLLILRFLVGFGFGVGQPSAVALLMEVSPAKWRCLNQGLAQIAFAIGELYCCMLLWLDDPSLENLRWRKLLVSAAGPALLFALLSWAFLGESPAHLESKGDLVGAEDVLDKMRRSNGQYHVDVSIELPRGNHSGAPTSKSPETAGGLQLHTICSGRLGMTTATLCFICFCQQQLWLFNPRLEASSCWSTAPPAAFRGSALASVATGVLPPSAVADASAPSSVNLVGLTAVGATLAAAASTSRRGQKVVEKSGRTAVVARRAETIAATAIANGNFTILVTALQKAGLVATVSGKSPYTVFAPIDAAFADLLKDGQKVTTAQSGQLAVQIAGGKVKVGRATVTAADIECFHPVLLLDDAVQGGLRHRRLLLFFGSYIQNDGACYSSSTTALTMTPARVLSKVMGSSGAFILLLQHFMAVTSTGSAEIIAVSSILTYDIYYTYLNPELASCSACKGCSACNGVIHVIDKASIQSFFSATRSKEDLGTGGYFSSLGSYIQNDGACYSSSTTALEKSCSFKKLAKDEWCCSSDVAVTGDGHHCRASTKDCIDVSESQHFESSECDFGAGERCVTSFLTMGSPPGLLFGITNIVGNFGTVFVDQSYWQSAGAANPKSQ
ncbi:unnamed protein product [Polarella glacialis]|uniref:Major facilitator superfamily (MFS) profile domain-containing protein n=1 Tax=Polarella glacialis TaxID=89957 RepID=A0A813K817_POLGL|nr:unnamed protein product [Polarella glacialis]